jgi:hypothetical protein
MEDDLAAPVAISSFRDPDSGPLPLSFTQSPTAPVAPALEPPKSEVMQLFDMIVARMAPMEREISRIAGIVDGTTTHKTPGRKQPSFTPSSQGPNPSAGRAPTTSQSRASSSTTRHIPETRVTAPPAAWVDDEDADFPELGAASSRRWTSLVDRRTSTPRAPAQGGMNSDPKWSNIGLSFASIVTEEAMGQ